MRRVHISRSSVKLPHRSAIKMLTHWASITLSMGVGLVSQVQGVSPLLLLLQLECARHMLSSVLFAVLLEHLCRCTVDHARKTRHARSSVRLRDDIRQEIQSLGAESKGTMRDSTTSSEGLRLGRKYRVQNPDVRSIS